MGFASADASSVPSANVLSVAVEEECIVEVSEEVFVSSRVDSSDLVERLIVTSSNGLI
jgi:hypothetical protein